MKYVNCGCGNKYVRDAEWINIDFNSKDEGVQPCNILKGLPFEDESVDAVFTSCMLEHFTKEQAQNFVAECRRVLKGGGILRIVIPDLEDVCREYLNILSLVQNNEKEYQKKYEYIIIELIDQMTRMYSGSRCKSIGRRKNAMNSTYGSEQDIRKVGKKRN